MTSWSGWANDDAIEVTPSYLGFLVTLPQADDLASRCAGGVRVTTQSLPRARVVSPDRRASYSGHARSSSSTSTCMLIYAIVPELDPVLVCTPVPLASARSLILSQPPYVSAATFNHVRYVASSTPSASAPPPIWLCREPCRSSHFWSDDNGEARPAHTRHTRPPQATKGQSETTLRLPTVAPRAFTCVGPRICARARSDFAPVQVGSKHPLWRQKRARAQGHAARRFVSLPTDLVTITDRAFTCLSRRPWTAHCLLTVCPSRQRASCSSLL